jgi:TM2 domain-containing membrane protein YozV
MDANKVDMFMIANAKCFESHHLTSIRERLLQLDDARWPDLIQLQFKDPSNIQIFSMLGGSLGIDRFLLGDTGLGVGKLLTCGGFGIWTIVDWFIIQGATREKNTALLSTLFY